MTIFTSNGNANPSTFLLGGGKISPIGIIKIIPVQIMGFNPVEECESTECRDDGECEYAYSVLAKEGDTEDTHNDQSEFLFEFPDAAPDTACIRLQKWNGVVWGTFVTYCAGSAPPPTSYGIFYDFGDLAREVVMGFLIDWQKVITNQGEGLYRLLIESEIDGFESSLCSKPYKLFEWSCEKADCTVRFDIRINGGKYGSITDDKYQFNLCGDDLSARTPGKTAQAYISMYDSVRIAGFFGNQKDSLEETEIIYSNGNKSDSRAMLIPAFEFLTSLDHPKYVHDRLKAYGFMAGKLINNEIVVSDFNVLNSDYSIYKKAIVVTGGYEPRYNKFWRKLDVKVDFEQRMQNVNASKCC